MGTASYIFSIIITLVLPLAAVAFLGFKNKKYLISVLLGAATFFVFQIVLRLPLLNLLSNVYSFKSTTVYILFLAFTAALFEEFGRLIVIKLFMKNKLNFINGVAFGIGHGGIEAILLVGINMVYMFVVSISYGGAQFDVNVLYAGIERLSTMCLHIAWSVLVVQSIKNKKPILFAIAFFTHMAIDTFAGFANVYGISFAIIETILFIIAVLACVWLVFEFRKEKLQNEKIII